MNVSQNNLDAVSAKLRVSIAPEDYTEKYEAQVKNFRKKANLNGFRPGCAPVGLIKKMYGKGLLAQAVEEVLGEALYNYIGEKKLDVLGEPMADETQSAPTFAEGETFEFAFDVAMTPELPVRLDKNTKIDYYTIQVSQDLIDKQIASFRGRFGKYVPADQVEKTDLVKGDLVELDEAGQVKEGGVSKEDVLVSPNYMKDEAEQKKFMGAKVGDTVVFNPGKAFAQHAAELSSLGIDTEAAATFNADCRLTVKEVKRYAEAEMNQEFFDACFGKDVVTSEADFTEKIKTELAEQFREDSDIKFVMDMRQYVLDNTKDVSFADALLKRWLKAKNEKMTDAELAEEYPKMMNDLKWQLVKDKLAKEAELKVEKEDVNDMAKRAAKAQFTQYGMVGVPNDVLEGYAKNMLENKDTMKTMTERALERKIIALLKERIFLKEKSISLDDFNKFFEQPA